MATSTTFICSRCEGRQCLLSTRNCQSYGAFGDGGNLPEVPLYCPVDELEPRWRMTLSPTERAPRRWLVEELHQWVDEHYDEVPEFIRDAAYGQLIHSERRSWLRQINILDLMASDEVAHCYDDDDLAKKAIAKATKWEIVNDLIPSAFAAGVIYAYIRLKDLEPEWRGIEYPNGDE